MTEDGLSESLQEMDFSGIPSIVTAGVLVFRMGVFFSIPNCSGNSGTYCLLTSYGIDELPEQWLVDWSQDIEPCLPAEEMYVFHSNIHNHLDL
jgi:hypothetical protein